jgi:hypothetical protein
VTVFSAEALLQLQARADCLPQEQVASWAQAQESDLPQQVVGLTMLAVLVAVCGCSWVFGIVRMVEEASKI